MFLENTNLATFFGRAAVKIALITVIQTSKTDIQKTSPGTDGDI